MDFLSFLKNLIAIDILFSRSSHYVLWWAFVSPHFDLGYCRVNELCNWCVRRLEVHEMMLLKEEEMYILEETVNAELGAWSQGVDAELSSSFPWLVVVAWSGRWCGLFLIYIYIYIVFFFKNPWRLAARCWRWVKNIPGIYCYQVGMRDQEPHLLRTPKMVSPDATHKQLLRFLMLTITGSWERKPLSPRGLVVIWNMEGGLKSWIDCWERGQHKGRWFKVLPGWNRDR